jgi:hypothetical protein
MFHHYVTNVTQNKVSSSSSYVIASAIGSTIGVLHKWTNDNFQMPPESVADILTQSFVTGMLPFMS